MHSPDLTQQNLEKIRAAFPNCVTEARDAQGNLKLAIDFDLLKQELSDSIVEGPQERYRLDWPGKREAMLTANAPIAKTLRPARDESVNFDTTENLFIEGDNLDALKLLQESYLGKVKMIYIDPPYNTGSDSFVYDDDFSESAEDFLIRSNQKDDEGYRFTTNSESRGRFHSDWLSMILPRLKLSWNLLGNEGVIFISIDDNEKSTLVKVCNEIFGEKSYLGCFVWKRRSSSAMSMNNISTDHEYVIAYRKGEFGFKGLSKDFQSYRNPDKDPRGDWVLGDLTVGMTASMRPNQAYDLKDPKTGLVYKFNPNRVWAYIPESMDKLIEEDRVYFPNDITKRPMLKRFRSDLEDKKNPVSSLLIDTVGLNTEATRQIRNIFGENYFNYTKPISLISLLAEQSMSESDIVLDFFAGSSTTAHAVMQLNAEDGGNRKFIMVQLPEEIDEKHEAYKAGYKTIAEISKERIRRAGQQILEGECHEDWNKDVGFRVLKVDTSNMKDVYYNPNEISQADLLDSVDHIKPDRSSEDLLFQVLLDWGVDLTLPIRRETIHGKEVFIVDQNALVACFERGVTEELVAELAQLQPLRMVFRDNGFASDSIKINATQIFKQRSPMTDVKSI